MRSKGALDSKTSAAKEWQLESGKDIGMKSVEVVNKNGRKEYVVHSVSGNERNKLFMNREGKSFVDVSALSGADSKADSRVVAYSDLNHDGFQDLLVVNGNNPHLEIFANRFAGQGGNFLAVRLIGGNDGTASNQWSNRDGVGAVVVVSAGEQIRSKELRCGEGFSAQNSNLMFFGLADLTAVDWLEVRWPSGKIQRHENIEANQIVEINEKSEQPKIEIWEDSFEFPESNQEGMFKFDALIARKDHQLRVFTTVETTCPNCRQSAGKFRGLVNESKALPVAFFALPTSPTDTQSDIDDYVSSTNPAYEVLDFKTNDRAAFRNFVAQKMGAGVSPAYLITDIDGRLLYFETDMPTISDVRRLLYAIAH